MRAWHHKIAGTFGCGFDKKWRFNIHETLLRADNCGRPGSQHIAAPGFSSLHCGEDRGSGISCAGHRHHRYHPGW